MSFSKSSSGGAGSQGGDYFENVTGRSQYERQSWRDSYNDGKAAGDVTGNVNDRLDRERSSFQGATWSGSSTQLSALELAQAMGRGGTGPASGQLSTSPGSVQTAGPGVPSAGTKPGGTLVMGPGGALPTKGPLKAKLKPNITQVMFGQSVHPNPWFSDYEDLETRYGEIVGNLAGLAILAADYLETNQVNHGDGLLQHVGRGPGAASGLSDWWEQANSPFGPDHPIPGFVSGGF